MPSSGCLKNPSPNLNPFFSAEDHLSGSGVYVCVSPMQSFVCVLVLGSMLIINKYKFVDHEFPTQSGESTKMTGAGMELERESISVALSSVRAHKNIH